MHNARDIATLIRNITATRLDRNLNNLTSAGKEKINSNPVGTIISYSGSDTPNGYLPMDGRVLSRVTYKKLFDVIGTSQGEGDGETTFGIADLTDERYLVGSTNAGNSVSAGLPNLTGVTYVRCASAVASSGVHTCSSEVEAGQNYWLGTDNNPTYAILFDASNSNSIYGVSDTVTPKSLKVRYFIKY